MKRQRFLTVTVGVMALSVGLILMTDSAGAAPKIKSEGTPTHNWDENLPSDSRFTVLSAFGGAAVRDNNTGLVWEQTPDATHFREWGDATLSCLNKEVGGTVGWRLPSVVELKSVQDPSLPPPHVPSSAFTISPTPGGPTPGVQSFIYWSASQVQGTTNPWVLNFGVIPGPPPFPVWCVRGPMQESVY
jgi:Protein of unknown function (DUF1566)